MNQYPSPHPRAARGFTLLEACFVTAIVGLGIVGVLQLIAAGSMSNIESNELTTAVFLADGVNELMQGASYGTLKSTYDNQTYSPPKDGSGNTLSGFSDWQQVIDVSYVNPDLLTSAVPDSQVEATSMVTITIMHNNKLVYSVKRIVASPS